MKPKFILRSAISNLSSEASADRESPIMQSIIVQ